MIGLLKHLHSDDTPGQVGAGLALGAILGLTPLLNLHNVVVLILIIMLRVSFSGALLGWLLFTPLGFAFDPLFDALGHRLLLETPALTGVWTTLYNTPVVPLTNFNNTVVLGSLAVALALFLPLNALGRFGVRRYRAAVQTWVRRHQPPPPPPAPGTTSARRYPPPSRPARRVGGGGLIRWQGTGPLLLFVGLLVGGWLLFADRLAKRAFESVGTAIVGAKVEVGRLHLDLSHGKVALNGLVVASPDEPFKNLLEADELTADIGVAPLLEKKVVIDRLAANGLRFGTARQADGRTAGPSEGIKAQVGEFVQRLDVPLLQLAVGKVEVGQLDPNILFTGREAQALVARADSAQAAWNAAVTGLDVQAAGDSGVAMAGRLRNAKPTDIGLLADARRTLSQVRQARARVEAVDREVKSGIASLQAGAADLAAVRRRDYAIGRRVLKVPSLDLPSMGAALFGPAAAARFQRALYWSRVAREYMRAGRGTDEQPAALRATDHAARGGSRRSGRSCARSRAPGTSRQRGGDGAGGRPARSRSPIAAPPSRARPGRGHPFVRARRGQRAGTLVGAHRCRALATGQWRSHGLRGAGAGRARDHGCTHPRHCRPALRHARPPVTLGQLESRPCRRRPAAGGARRRNRGRERADPGASGQPLRDAGGAGELAHHHARRRRLHPRRRPAYASGRRPTAARAAAAAADGRHPPVTGAHGAALQPLPSLRHLTSVISCPT